jgi:DNA-binding NarL/FixJ family response regulator
LHRKPREILKTSAKLQLGGKYFLTKQLKPDIVLMDLDMPAIGGFEASIKLLRSVPDIKIIILTSQEGVIFLKN